MKIFYIILLACITLVSAQTENGEFLQEQSTFYSTESGLPTRETGGVCVLDDHTAYAATDSGLFCLANGIWKSEPGLEKTLVIDLASSGDQLQVLYKRANRFHIGIVEDHALVRTIELRGEKYDGARLHIAHHLCTNNGIFRFDASANRIKLKRLIKTSFTINDMAMAPDGSLWIAADVGLFKYYAGQKTALPIFPSSRTESWALTNVRGVAFDAKGQLWFASSQGVGCYTGSSWELYTGSDGLPYHSFTCLDAGGDGAVWFGTDKGAIRFDDSRWAYRQGLRWLPDDFINDIAVDQSGASYCATPRGISFIEWIPMTLAEKAAWYEEQIDRYHRRTPYEYVLDVHLEKAGDKSSFIQHDSDNDGLWTSMYGAGECFAYAATGDPLAKKRADQAFKALEFLAKVTQGGSHSAPRGFVARTILPTDGPDPNEGRIERDLRHKAENDSLWKIISPRWPKSQDGKWYWKTDTSSDELDGHYFFYGLYYDLVAETQVEKNLLRFHVAALTDHLIEHDFQLVDHDGKPTRWARFNPYELNHDRNWVFDRNLNSLSMLAYLVTAAHITDDKKYTKYAEYLVENHGYLQNAQLPKTQRGIGTGNQSDDEMAMMMLYNFIKYAPHKDWKDRIALACWTYGRLELPEMNPFFNFIYAASCSGQSFTDAWGTYSLEPVGPWLEDAIETLQRFPLDRIDWQHDNSRRIDIMPIDDLQRHFDEDSYAGRGRRVNGKVIPVDERHFNHWNHDPYDLVTGGNGHTLSDGAVFTLPYYMGLYYGYIMD
ncbi:hypothetical protein EH223_10790 [candidate division KSB1 bacterium]|nr:hypothetical protein [candidate division KSB1 bacterium]RQW03107.1 MAG: hypothetical protein EH223_10790 [candidate division KSB1 bacterium]